MIGQIISHYKILEKLGEGGMGVVYKAHDTKLDRVVALKFLPPYLSSDVNEKERFHHEARAASALLHANVAVIFEVNEHDGRIFLAMEYVEGQTLKKLIEDSDPLPLKKVLDFAIQACEGLVAAHEKGIVHRDIKSDNIMITSKGQVKIMDFGLAKVKGATKLTKAGSTIGTAAYMSPEQAQGEEVDQRSDIFSFGVVLYEMLTGNLPFRGEHQAALMYSLINEDPLPIARFNDKVPPDVERIVMKALAKDRDDRYQHADDILADLRRERKQLEYAKAGYTTTRSVAQAGETKPSKKRYTKTLIVTGAAVLLVALAVFAFFMRRGPTQTAVVEPSRKMLAVLPFENLGAPDQEYFAEGITEEITSKLSGLSGLGVIAHSSAVQYKKTTKPIKQIGEELGVSYILQGTVRWENAEGTNRVRVTPQLINVADGTQIWSQPAEAVLASAFKLQSEIASQVASALDITLLQHEKRTLEATFTNNSEAYDYYLRGSEYAYKGYQEKDFRIAVQMFERAVELDPKFAKAYAQLAALHSDIYWEFYDHTEERVQKTKDAAETALKLDPDLPDAHGAMGWYYYHCRLDYENALKEFNLALKLQPNNTYLLMGVASVFRRQGKLDDALARFKQAVDIDPRSADFAEETATTLNLMRNFSEAEQYFDRAISLAPDVVQTYCDKTYMYIQWRGDVSKARAVLDEAARQKTDISDPYFVYNTIMLDVVEKRYQEAIDRMNNSGLKAIDLQYWYLPKEMITAQIEGYLKKTQDAQGEYTKALAVLEPELKSHPDDGRLHSSLGIIYAGLRRKEEAIREGQRGVDLLPIARDAIIGTIRVQDLAQIYTMVGEKEKAIDAIEQLLRIPSLITISLLRVDPVWNPLRENNRFQKYIAEN